MNKKILALSLACLTLFATGCHSVTSSGYRSADDRNTGGEQFTLTGRVISVTDRLEIEVTDSEYASGVYWVLISDETEIVDKDGNQIFLSDIRPEDTVDVVYGGQVMMSCPPQIAARRVTLE